MRRLRAWYRSAAREALDAAFPIACLGCGAYGTAHGSSDGEHWLCAICRERLHSPPLRCVVCGALALGGRTCFPCRQHTPLSGLVAVGQYADPVLRSAVTHLKFRGARALASPLGELLARRLVAAGLGNSTTEPPDPTPQSSSTDTILVPLPLHRRRERGRGYNQARLLAQRAQELLGFPVADLLVRTRHTAPQTTIAESPDVRRQNVAEAFAVRPRAGGVPASRVILVDDVFTTGATMTEAARVLTTHGVGEVWGAVVARG